MGLFSKKEPKKILGRDDTDETENSIEQVGEEDAQIKDDVPSVNQAGRDGGNAKNFKIMAVALVGIIIMLIGSAMAIGRYQQSKADKKAQETERQAQEQKNMITSGSRVDIEADKQAMQSLPPPADFSDLDNDDDTADMVVAQPVVTPAPQPQPQPRYNDYNSPMVAGRDYAPPAPIPAPQPQPMIIYDDKDDDEPTAPAPTQTVQVEHSSVLVDVYGSRTATTARQETGLAGSMRSSSLANGTVNSRGDVSMMLLQGTTIPCVLKTRVDSTYQGFTICQVAKDVYSANGKVLLIERGSSVFGEQNIQMSQGKARVAILWGKIETPKNMSINIDSPATGQLGEMGVGAKVNNHFWKRFGGAIMLSLIQDAISAGTTHLEKDKSKAGQTTIENTSSTAESIAEKALENTINIPPTATINQGTVINIMVARDVDFSSIYSLRRQ